LTILAFILRALIAQSNSRWARRISQKSSRKILKKQKVQIAIRRKESYIKLHLIYFFSSLLPYLTRMLNSVSKRARPEFSSIMNQIRSNHEILNISLTINFLSNISLASSLIFCLYELGILFSNPWNGAKVTIPSPVEFFVASRPGV
jgi:hypothetical protein